MMRIRVGFFALFFLAITATLLAPAAVASPQPPTITLRIRNHPILVEVARTEAEREKGLMNRKSLPPGHGMLFVFNHVSIRYFWMKNTSIPLDIAFLNSAGKILTIQSMKPFDLTPVSSGKPCRYALEMNAGFFKRVGARPGDKVSGLHAL